MLIVGAGGHALEVLDVLLESTLSDDLFFYDDINMLSTNLRDYCVLNSEEGVINNLPAKFNFILGIGNPVKRQLVFNKFTNLGGAYLPLISSTSIISQFANGRCYDVMKNCFIGPETNIGKACLINTGAQIHHEVEIGEFSEISPMAIILGKAKIGSNCSIGSNATILPNVIIGSNVIIGAGAVVTKNIMDHSVAVGNPAKVIRSLKE
jgi:sugar O-acyltransferase (sialic acid O-acetyltransferase NeuD family)